jgi:hypothetical protein
MLINAASGIDPLQVIYGSRRVGGTYVIPPSVSGASNEYLHLVIALCEGEISAINTVYLDDVATTDARFTGLVTAEKFLGTDTQSASAFLMAALPGKWTAAHQGKGVAYLHVQIKADQNAFTSLPVVTCDIDGKKVYDPRDGLTKLSNNPALCLRDYLASTRYGRGIASAMINDASLIVAANHCDELVSIPGGGTQKRYTCDGVVNIDDTAYANIQRLLSSCRGMLIFSGGVYKLVIDKLETPSTFTFNEDNITGAWEFHRPGKRELVNKVSASFFNPANAWNPDIAIQDSATYRAQDNGQLLERKIDLPYTADIYRAGHLAQLEMKATRFGTVVRFIAFQDGLRCEVGDVVPITHSTPGWTAKPFRIMTIDILDTDNVSITAREYDAAAYTLDVLNAVASAQQTTLPDPFAVGQPGSITVAESLFETRSGVKSKALVSCMASSDIFVREYQLEYQLSGAAAWVVLPKQAATGWEVPDLVPGIYDWRVAGINTFGVISSYATVRRELFGLLAKPADLTGLVVQSVSALDVLTFTQSTDLDVRIGGQILVRHSPLLAGATWEKSTTACAPLPGGSTSAVFPLRSGTYFIKAQDSSGLQSQNAASFVSNGSSLFTYTTLGTVQEDPVFPGMFTNTYHDSDVGDVLELVGAAMFDAGADFDTGSMFDYAGGIISSGYYDFASGIDLGSVKQVRLTSTLSATAENVLAMFDDGVDFDAGLDFDKSSGAPVDAWVEVRSANDDPSGAPAWSAWQRLTAADFNARGFQFRAHLTSNDPVYNIAIDQLRIKAEAL